jgi:methyltransferase family protein
LVDSAKGLEPADLRTLRGMVAALGSRSIPDLDWIMGVAGCTRNQAVGAVEQILGHAQTVRRLVEKVKATDRTFYAQFPAPIDLFSLVRLTHPACLVESGVSAGFSTTFLLMGAAPVSGSRLHSIDLPVPRRNGRGNESWAIPEAMYSGWAVPAELKRGWDLRIGRSEELLGPLLKEVGTVDFYCHDSPVNGEHFKFELEALKGHLGPGSVVVADNSDLEIFADLAKSLGANLCRRKKSSLAGFRIPVIRRQ